MNQENLENSFSEIWTRLDLGSLQVEGNYYVSTFSYEDDGFKIVLEQEDANQIVEILFPYEISAVRIVDEGLRMRLYHDLSVKYGDDFYIKWAFFIVEQSEYLKWLAVQSYEISDHCELKHFVIKALDCLLDVVTRREPEIKILNSR